MARALRVMNEFSASLSTAATRAEAESIPARRKMASSVASPITAGWRMSISRDSSCSTTTRRRPASMTSAAIAWPTRPQPQMTTWSFSDAIDRSMRRLPSSSLRRPSITVSMRTPKA